ncbi:DUF1592 domain-containing protein [Tautonia rosea]|uniref:DUF1592 domain-containing protein n=1 Tax=Tautonia rosea TaxID=2728037 RepID=UPI0014757DC2|nr:DUF1592 domain-containing protein [Tautonia rosea]
MPAPKVFWIGWATLGTALLIAGLDVDRLQADAQPDDDTPSFETLAADFERVARPLLQTYCLDCHDSAIAEAGIDLERFDGIDDLRAASPNWQKVARVLDLGEMPPPGADPIPSGDRDQLRSWIDQLLRAEAQANAGDPGPVLLRRLSNAQYTHTIRDLTGLDTLDPAREFPTDSAAGEGFTNAGAALVMSPSLLEKYLEAAKQIADHAVLLPDGFRFSSGTSRRDWTDEAVARIKDFYARFTADSGGTPVNLQGIVFATNEGGRLPLERYFAALLDHRDRLRNGDRSIEAVASDYNLSPRYLRLLFDSLEDKPETPSAVFDPLRSAWRSAVPGDAERLTGMVAPWQTTLWRFNSVGHLGKVGGPTAWMEPVSPLVDRHEIRLDFPDTSAIDVDEILVTLALTDAGDGSTDDLAVWERPRIVTPGRPDLPLRDLRAVAHRLQSGRDEALAHAFACLDAAFASTQAADLPDLDTLAADRGIPRHVLDAWFNFLGIGVGPPEIPASSLLATPIRNGGGYDFVRGWGNPELPNTVANSSDQHVRIPGNLRPHGIAVHPTPDLRVAAGWRSPIHGSITLSSTVQHAHPECGNGVTWRLELRRPGTRRRLASGTAQGTAPVTIGPFEKLPVQPGDLVVLSIGARDGNHSCDLTAVDLTISSDRSTWDLAADVSPDIDAGNPHADRLGHDAVWHFFTEPDSDASTDATIPAGSLLAQWQDAPDLESARQLAHQIQTMLDQGPPDSPGAPDALLFRQLSSLRGPLLSRIGFGERAPAALPAADADTPQFGLDPDRFGHDPEGQPIDPQSLGVRAPSLITIRLPAELVAGSQFVTEGRLLPSSGAEASVQFVATVGALDLPPVPKPDRPIVIAEGSQAQARLARELDAFRSLFPPALCYSQIVPVDEVITLMLHYREDDHLRRLMLNDAQAAELDRLWNELRFISHDALTTVDAFQQLLEYASQDGDPSLFEPLRQPIEAEAEAFRTALIQAEPRQVDALFELAARAYRRPLSDTDREVLNHLYQSLRQESLAHNDAFRLTLARIFIAPSFLYRVEQAPPVEGTAPLSNWELASRLSYFLWASVPDEPLRSQAASGDLTDPDVLAAEARRMLDDDRVRRLAEEFACQWLQVYDFPSLDEKSERHFPTFAALRPAMYEETIRFFTDLFRNDRPVSALLDADYTFLNNELARHYGIDGINDPDWQRVDGIRRFDRGGILGLGATLAKQSGASRTSPILRGIWISEVLLGEPLPNPPSDVPDLPDDETDTDGLTVRELVERHTQDPRCSGCHARIDPFGFALEGFDAIGRSRAFDLADRPVDTRTVLPDQTEIDGLDGLRQYLLTARRDDFVRQFCRKLLGYALGRGVLLSDEPLLDEMQRQLKAHDERVSAAIETIVRSPQFREIRGRGRSSAESQ